GHSVADRAQRDPPRALSPPHSLRDRIGIDVRDYAAGRALGLSGRQPAKVTSESRVELVTLGGIEDGRLLADQLCRPLGDVAHLQRPQRPRRVPPRRDGDASALVTAGRRLSAGQAALRAAHPGRVLAMVLMIVVLLTGRGPAAGGTTAPSRTTVARG